MSTPTPGPRPGPPPDPEEAIEERLCSLEATRPADLDALLATGAAVDETLRSRLRDLSGE